MLKQSLQQKLLQKLSPQQIQLMKLLQLPAVALEQRIKEEIEVNPALEEGAPEDADEQDDQQDEVEEIEEAVEENEGEEIEKVKEEFDNSGEEEVRDRSADDFDVEDYITDEDVPYYKTVANNSSADDEKTEMPFGSTITFQENLLSQLGLIELDNKEYMIAQHLIGSLDEDGYLRRDLNSIVKEMMAADLALFKRDQYLKEGGHKIINYNEA